MRNDQLRDDQLRNDRLIVIGVRHHSPACARLVRATIERVRPAFVLIEGPCDFNPMIDDLRLAHTLPVAIFSFCTLIGQSRASYAPFCDYSPEWQALRSAWAVGAAPLFCDLPVWHGGFSEPQASNRFADPHRLYQRREQALTALIRALGEDGHDALWDTLAEQADPEELEPRLARYFRLLRPEGAADPAEHEREACMGGYAAWALRTAGDRPVVLVCGGWHAAGVRAALASAGREEPRPPPPPAGARTGAYLVPYSYARLDRFSGYSAGMPSPGYYHAVHDGGLDHAADWAMQRVIAALRAAGQPISTADWVGWHTHALALARLRGHRAILRTDLLDAALACLVKGALEIPPPWHGTKPVSAPSTIPASGEEPLSRLILVALAGEREGRVAPDARRPPLITDVQERLTVSGLTPAATARRVTLDWQQPQARTQAHLLHQLVVLAVPGFLRLGGPADPAAARLIECFEIVANRDWQGRVMEASQWGGTLPAAAACRLGARLAERPGMVDHLAALLSTALFAGLFELGQDLAHGLAAAVLPCQDITPLGRAARLTVHLYRFGEVFGPAAQSALEEIVTAMFGQMLGLLEGERGEAGASIGVIDVVLACRDIATRCPELTIDAGRALAVLRRCVADINTPPRLAGAALGYLITAPAEAAEPVTPAAVTACVRRFAVPERLGDFLSGLFALAREKLTTADADEVILTAVAELVDAWSDQGFLLALPALRGAFAWFPPREREVVATRLLRHFGLGRTDADIAAMSWLTQPVAITDQAAALALEARTAERLAGHGLTAVLLP